MQNVENVEELAKSFFLRATVALRLSAQSLSVLTLPECTEKR